MSKVIADCSVLLCVLLGVTILVDNIFKGELLVARHIVRRNKSKSVSPQQTPLKISSFVNSG